MPRRPPSLVIKFIARTLPPVITAAFLLMLFFGYMTWKDVREEINTDVEAYATSLSHVLDGLMWNLQSEELVSALGTISSNPALRGARLFDERANQYLVYGELPKEAPDLLTIHRDIFKRHPDGSRTDIGKLEIYYSYAESDKHFRNIVLAQASLIILSIIIVTTASLFGYRKTIGTPLKILLGAIHSSDASGKWVQADWKSEDEIGEIINAHNSLIRHISKKETALADSERRYRHLFDTAQIGIFQTRPDGTIKEANKTFADILGFSSTQELQKTNMLDRYAHPEQRDKLWTALMAKGEIIQFQIQLIRHDNKLIWVDVSGRLSPDNSLNGVLQDVTVLVDARKALEERDELHRAFFEENKAVMLLHDPLDSSIQFVNPAACNFYGYSEEELTSMYTRDLDCMSDKEVFDELRKAAEDHRSYFKHIHTLKDGTKRHVEVFTGPVSMANRQLHYSIVHDVTEKRRLESKLERMATRDQLTGAYNRHAFFQTARDEIVRAQRFGHPMAVLMFDLDHFKDVNDTYGHATGDEVLRTFALRCRGGLRQSDIFARLGGEEFSAILIETGEKRAMEVAERIRNYASITPIPTESGPLIVTTSVGVASLTDEDTVTTVLKRADAGLYEAKNSGRNSVIKT